MESIRWFGLLAVAALIVLPLSSSSAQDKEEDKKAGGVVTEEAGSGIKAEILQTEGVKNAVENAGLLEERLGILSLTKVPTDTFKIMIGNATLSINILDIKTIAIEGESVTVTGIKGETVKGFTDKDGRYYLTGKVGIGKFEIDLRNVRNVAFTQPPRKLLRCDACNRLYAQDWSFCPFDGQKLKKNE